jgi:hypothetical protein
VTTTHWLSLIAVVLGIVTLTAVLKAVPNRPARAPFIALLILLLMVTDGVVAGAMGLRDHYIPTRTQIPTWRALAVFLPVAVVTLTALLVRWRMGARWFAAGAIAFVSPAFAIFVWGSRTWPDWRPLLSSKVPGSWIAGVAVLVAVLLLAIALAPTTKSRRSFAVALCFVVVPAVVAGTLLQLTTRGSEEERQLIGACRSPATATHEC